MKNLLFRVTRIVREQFELQCSTQSAALLPGLIIRYFESALIFIANDAERPTAAGPFQAQRRAGHRWSRAYSAGTHAAQPQ